MIAANKQKMPMVVEGKKNGVTGDLPPMPAQAITSHKGGLPSVVTGKHLHNSMKKVEEI